LQILLARVGKTCAIAPGYVDGDTLAAATAGVKELLVNGKLKLSGHANVVVGELAEGTLNEKELAQYVKDKVLKEVDQTAILNAWNKLRGTQVASDQTTTASVLLDLPREGEKMTRQAAVTEVFKLPEFQSLGKLMKDVKPSAVEVIGGERTKFVHQLIGSKAAACKLRINDLDMEGIVASNPEEDGQNATHRPKNSSYDDYFWFHFPIVETSKNAQAWEQLRKQIPLSRRVSLTLGCSFGGVYYVMDTAIDRDPESGAGTTGFSPVRLVMIGAWKMTLAVGVMLLTLLIFAACAFTTDLIRDPQGQMRPDGVLPFSLGRTQMAFWFLIVVGAFLFLWLTQKTMPTLNDTCLWLIGIGSATALGAAAIGDTSTAAAQTYKVFPFTRNWGERRTAFGVRLSHEIKRLKERLNDSSDIEDGALAQQVAEHEKQIAAFRSQPKTSVRRLLGDWLTEDNRYSFHRYQMLVWTIVLGTVFVVSVAQARALPTFDGTLLALLGISNGTYLGFRLQPLRNP
jgi:hypothetical protein